MNIILLIIDTMRYDYIGANGNDWIETPNLDHLALQSWCFDRAFAASFPTIPYRTDVMTGKYGSPFHAWKPLPFNTNALPDVLGEAGYATQLLHDTPHLVNGGHAFDYPFHTWTFIRGAEVDRAWINDEAKWPSNWAKDPLFDILEDELPTPTIQYARTNRGRENLDDWNCARLFNTAMPTPSSSTGSKMAPPAMYPNAISSTATLALKALKCIPPISTKAFKFIRGSTYGREPKQSRL